jgi:hypothetical protein
MILLLSTGTGIVFLAVAFIFLFVWLGRRQQNDASRSPDNNGAGPRDHDIGSAQDHNDHHGSHHERHSGHYSDHSNDGPDAGSSDARGSDISDFSAPDSTSVDP